MPRMGGSMSLTGHEPMSLTEHVCEWEIILGRSKADCKVKNCREKLSLTQIVTRLNEYETLRRATILLDKEGARLIATDIEQNSDLTRRYVAVLRGYADIVE